MSKIKNTKSVIKRNGVAPTHKSKRASDQHKYNTLIATKSSEQLTLINKNIRALRKVNYDPFDKRRKDTGVDLGTLRSSLDIKLKNPKEHSPLRGAYSV